MRRKNTRRFVTSAIAAIFALSIVSLPISAFTNETVMQSTENMYLAEALSDFGVDKEFVSLVQEIAKDNAVINAQNISKIEENLIEFQKCELVGISARDNMAGREYRLDTATVYNLARGNRDGELSGEESDSTGVFTLSSTVYYTLFTTTGSDGGEGEFIRITRVEGRRSNAGMPPVTIVSQSLRIGQTGWAVGGYVNQYKDYSPGSSWSYSIPTSMWEPILTSAEYVVGATYSATIKYSDGSSERVEFTNNV